jgi:hypothetical protein
MRDWIVLISKDLCTEEFMIIGIQDRFIESGDSGSFVVDSTGAALLAKKLFLMVSPTQFISLS